MGDAGLHLGSTLHAEGLLELVEQKMGCSCTMEAEKFLPVGAEVSNMKRRYSSISREPLFRKRSTMSS